MNSTKKQPKVVSSEKASKVLKVSSKVRAGLVTGVLGGTGCRTCGILHVQP